MKNSTSTARLVAFLSLAYALLGAVGLTLAIPPGYASPVFPASGLALACVLWFERRALPGVWLGSALLNLSHAWLGGTLNPATAAVAAVIATGATAQAWAGSWLVNRWQGPVWRDLEREQDVFGFLMLGGGLACVLSASISVTGLYAAGVIEGAEFLFTWWNWYVGDAVGVLVFAPLTLCLLNAPQGLWGERRRRIVVPMLLTLGLVVLAFYGTARWERQTQDNRLQTDGETIAKRIADRLITHREVIFSLRNFIEATPDFSFRQFEQFTQLTLQDNPDIFALSFNDLITNDRRLTFERIMSGVSPLGPFQITERDRQRRLVRAATRPEYVAVRYIVPLVNNQPAIGYDIHSDPLRRNAINRARASKSMAVTSPIQLVQEQKKRVGILELLPVESLPAAGAKGNSARLLGFAVAVVKVDEMIEIATRGQTPAGLVFQLIDPHAPDGQGLLYRSEASGAGNTLSSRAANWKAALRVGDRDWELSVSTTESYRQQHRPRVAWAVGVVGLMFATLLQILMLGMTGRAALVQRKNEEIHDMARTLEGKVIERTEQLSNANRKLTAEIVEHRTTEQALKKSENQVRLLLNSTAEAIYGIDLKGNCTFANPSCLKMLGYADSEDLLGRNMHAMIHHSHPDGAPLPVEECSIYQAFRESRGIHRDDEVFWRADGAAIPVEYWSYPQIVDGEVTGAVVAFVDITDRKRAGQEIIEAKELAEAATRAKGEFLASMSHEIRTPMNAIIGMADLLLDSPLTEEQAKYVNVFRNAGENLLRIINDILDFSKIEAGQVSLESINFSLHDLIESIVEIMAFKAAEKKIGLFCTAAQDIDDELVGDPSRLRQILLNLVGNALKFTTAGNVHITVEKAENRTSISAALSRDTICLRFAVKDTGIGIAPEVVETIFDKFTQADASMSRKFGGTGLGLAICRQLVTLMDGTLWVESTEGAGSTFYFTVCLKKGPHGSPAGAGPQDAQTVSDAATVATERSLRILIVEDNEDNRFLLLSYLKKLPHAVDVAVNGQEAVDRIREGRSYDIILMDVQMPVMDGYAATRHIRDWEEDHQLQPAVIVALTAHALQEDEQKSIAAGCDGHLTKPIKKQEFLLALRSFRYHEPEEG